MAIEFTDANFSKEVIKSDKPVLVDFWAAGCQPCKMIAPIVDKLSHDLADQVRIGKLNVDDHPNTAQEYEVMSIPTLLMFKGGKVVGRTLGFQSEPALRAFIANAAR